MGLRTLTRKLKLQAGEVIRATDVLGFVPEGIYQVKALDRKMVVLSVGSIELGVASEMLIILERGLPEPADWKEHEKLFHIQNPHADNCEECRALREAALN